MNPSSQPVPASRRRVVDLRRRAVAAAGGVSDADSYVSACRLLLRVKAARHRVERSFAERKGEANRAHKAVCSLESSHDAPLEEAEAALKVAIARFQARRTLVPEVAGISTRIRFEVDVHDLEALVKGAAAGTVPIQFLMPNFAVLDGVASALHGNVSGPGLRVRPVRTVYAQPGRAS